MSMNSLRIKQTLPLYRELVFTEQRYLNVKLNLKGNEGKAMKKFITIVSILMVLLVIGLGTSAMLISAQETDSDVVFRLEREACFGTCPAYSVQIHADGTVIYDGLQHVDEEGERVSEIDPETVAYMLERFEALGYFEWDETYTDISSDNMPYVTTSVTKEGETHTIQRYTGDASAPVVLPYLENWIDFAAGTAGWTGVSPSDPYFSSAGGAPVMTLERQPCFGTCPVYRVALFSDGTIVYMGIRHVDNLGVHVYETSPDEISSLASWISQFYFDWEDAYDLYLVTDLPYTVTSLNGSDGGKQILRYHGDPNAPIGLVQFEEDIDAIVDAVME